jgi:ankyrin repeat protein
VDLPLTLYATKTWLLHLEEAQDIEQVVLQNKRFFSEGSASRDAYEDIMESIDWEFQEHLGPGGPTDSEDYATPLLHLACYRNLQRLVRWCLTDEQLRDINVPWGIESRKSLHFAIIQQNEVIINLLLNANADILAEAKTGQNAFVRAMYHHNTHIIRQMAEQRECKQWIMQEALNPRTTLLWEASWARNKDACRLLVGKFSFDVNSKIPQWGRAVIYDLIEWDYPELALIFLLEWHAHVDSWEALQVIIHHSQDRFHGWQRLLSININVKHEKGYNACVTASQAPSSRVSKLATLLCYGCNPNQPDNEGRTPLHYCAMTQGLIRSPQEFERILALLLSQKDAQVNGVCHKGWTILHYLTNSFSQPLHQYGPLPGSDARQLVVLL